MRTYAPSFKHEPQSNILTEEIQTSSLLLFASHIPLALFAYQYRALATGYAWATILIGLVWVLQGKKIERAAYLASYIVGAEVLWRMTKAAIFWEAAKYAIIAVIFLALLQRKGWKPNSSATLYFILLLPAIALTVTTMSLGDAREAISFNLSGPLTLTICIWYFANVRLTRAQMARLLVSSIAPIVGILAIAAYSTFTSASIKFGDEANFTTSGGFGPNQVSSILSLGSLFIYFLILNHKVQPLQKIILFALLIIFTAQSALTFSRSGLYMLGSSVFAASIFLVRDGKALFRNSALFIIFYLLATFLLLPWLDGFTGGAFSQRIQNTSLTGRDLLMQADLQIWSENLIMGVGPGVSANLHAILFRTAASHTEYTRMVAEHGLFGLFSLLLIIFMAFKNLQQASPAASRGIVAALLVWFALYLASSAMRLAAPSFVFGLAASPFFAQPDKEAEKAEGQASLNASRRFSRRLRDNRQNTS